MAATDTVADHADLVELGAVLPLRSPLPGVLPTIREEDVRAGRVESTLINSSLLSLGVDVTSDFAVEGVSAVLGEVGLVDDWAAHGVLRAHRLVPTVLSAVLEAPGATTAVHIDGGVGNDLTIVVGRVAATVLLHGICDFVLALSLDGFEHVAEASCATVLNSASRDIRVVG